MKVIFLDIDGVLNSMDNMRVNSFLLETENRMNRDEFGQLFDERCVRWLEWIINQTEAKIVISSAWRSMGISRLKLMWEIRDLPGEIIGTTPIQANDKIINKYACTNNEADRGYEIQEWIDGNNPTNYCIIDDDKDMLPGQNFVRTDAKIGLTYEVSNSVMSILNAI